MYTFKSRVRFSECDMDQKLTLMAILDYYQDVCSLQGIDIGLSWSQLKERGMIWVTNFWQIIIDRYPSTGEEITIGTQAWDFKAFLGSRNFNILDKEGRTLSYANSVWSLLDPATMTPIKTPQDVIDRYTPGERLNMDYAPRRIRIPAPGVRQEAFRVQEDNLDYNRHVNNAQYIRMALRYLPEGFSTHELLAEYKAQAHLGDLIVPEVTADNGDYYVSLNDENGGAYCIAAFKH